MPPKVKEKIKKKKKKTKKQKDGTGSVEEQYWKATLEVDVLQDHLSLQRQVTRQAQERKDELRGKLLELQEDLQEERDEKQAIYSAKSQHALQMLTEESQRIAKEKEAEITELKKEVENMGMEYETVLHSCLDQILSKLSVAEQQWTNEAQAIHQQHKQMLQDCGLNPLDI
ncbi:coiled-coil domain-containing protein 153 isoform X3 [Pseudophryne corroboree]|uniref:coiled-coil domain-containing protein 153 isoform X3 n=1 Tax=Pseudophryne corroboree TaxID=495146 RepID=UPI003081B3F3